MIELGVVNDCAVNGGCSAECCINTWFVQEMSLHAVLRFFSGAIVVNKDQFEKGGLDDGVYYYKTFLSDCRVRIVGLCPHLNGTDCDIHEREIPRPCAAMHRCSDACVDFRRRADRL